MLISTPKPRVNRWIPQTSAPCRDVLMHDPDTQSIWCNDNVIITSKRRRFDVIMTLSLHRDVLMHDPDTQSIWCNDNVIITSKRRRFDVMMTLSLHRDVLMHDPDTQSIWCNDNVIITSKRRRFDVIMTLSLHHVSAGWLKALMSHGPWIPMFADDFVLQSTTGGAQCCLHSNVRAPLNTKEMDLKLLD